MGKMYKPKVESGREYVDYTKIFCSKTIFYCLRLPGRWENLLLKPLTDAVQQIEAIVTAANRIYINSQSMDSNSLLHAYEERIGALQNALRIFGSFDAAFERLMNYIDIQGMERKRLKNIMLSILKESKEADPDLKELKIYVTDRGSDMEYESIGGVKHMKLGMTVQNRNSWLRSENDARMWIQKRITADRSIIVKLRDINNIAV